MGSARFLRQLWSAGLLITVLASFGFGPRAAADGTESDTDVPVVIGATVCFVVHRPQGEMTPKQRVERVHYVFAKYLGADEGTFTTVALGRHGSAGVAIYLNGDHVITVTPDDADLTRSKSCASVAWYWKKALEDAFEATHVRQEAPPK